MWSMGLCPLRAQSGKKWSIFIKPAYNGYFLASIDQKQ